MKISVIKNIKFSLWIALMFSPLLIRADSSANTTVSGSTNSELQEKAKNRTYIGGAEESDLKVLPESYFEKNKKAKAQETDEGF
jgi:hypothetical protein